MRNIIEHPNRSKKIVLLLNNGGSSAYFTPLLEKMIFACKRQMNNCFEIKTISLFDHIDHIVDRSVDTIVAIIISGSSIIDLKDICEKGEATSWNINIINMFPNATVFGICYGMQVLASMHGGLIANRDFGFRKKDIILHHRPGVSIQNVFDNIPTTYQMHVSHCHHVIKTPSIYTVFQVDENDDNMAMISNLNGRMFIGVQYHIEAPSSQPIGMQMLKSVIQYAIM